MLELGFFVEIANLRLGFVIGLGFVLGLGLVLELG